MNIRHVGRALGLAVMMLGTGCVPGQLTISVRAAPNVNQSRPVYMVIRTVDSEATYLSQSYDEVAKQVTTPDKSVIHRSVVYPGVNKQVNLKVPQSQPVAVSFLFTSPDGTWQTLLDALVPGTVDITLEGSRIQGGANTATEPAAQASASPSLPTLAQ